MDLSYPIGKFAFPATVTAEERAAAVRALAESPARFRKAVAGLTDAQLDTQYRPDGWTVRQVVHHMFDSHVNAYIRFRMALTENDPTIKPYDEAAWAELVDAKTWPVEVSLALFEGLHARLVAVLETMDDAAFARVFVHPERGRLRLDVAVAMYAWHCRHHEAHITTLRERKGW